jgi:hypothetical protein
MYLYTQTRYQMKQNLKYSSDCTVCLYVWHIHIVPLSLDTTLWVLNQFFEPVGVEFVRLFAKPFCRSSLNFIITSEMITFEMFLESCEQPEVRRCQIWPAGRVWINLKSNALYCRWRGSTSVGSGIMMLKKHGLFPNKCDLFIVSVSLGSVM